ncbi:glycosyltransferase [Pontimonas sp.]|uniref:glycosyltransferase n=1 Tax=Pontimonas sp. TaxID=2304492 RepID=UPI00287003E0|nr:glycosyltransferase [Pontimonas sp.]MDR9435094.1 glycosyltransferase [Pontimonas sp.]
MALRIAHLSFSSSGGAGTVATRLADIQRSMGHEATVISQIAGSLRDAPFAAPLHTAAATADQFLVKSASFDAPISLYRDRLSQQLDESLRGVDIIHLHWPHGLIDLDRLGEIAGSRPVVWTLHDMAAFTGVCHYSLGCERFTSGCAACPAVKGPFRGAVERHLTEKATALEGIHDLRVVSPSHWLAGEASRSPLFEGKDIRVIQNPLALSDAGEHNPDQQRASDPEGRDLASTAEGGDTAREALTFVVLAANLEDPLKGVEDAVEGFRRAFPTGQGATLELVGRGERGASIPGVVARGYQSSSEVAKILERADYLVVASRAENQPLAIAEAQAAGVSLIGREATGIPEHLEIDPEGALFDSVESLATVLGTVTPRSSTQRAQLAHRARVHYDPIATAQSYERVYSTG